MDDPAGLGDPALVVRFGRCAASDTGSTPLLIQIVGELDTYTVQVIESPLIESSLASVETDGPQIVFDLRGVSFMDGRGLLLLDQMHEHVIGRGGQVWLHEPSRHLVRVIAICGIDRFEVCEPTAERRSPRSRDAASIPQPQPCEWSY